MFDGYFLPKNQQAKIGPRQHELFELLITSLDFLVAGRGLEAADVLASQLHSLSVGVETQNWEAAK